MNPKDTETQRSELNQLSHRIIGVCMEVHRELGPGLLESAYEEALAHELTHRASRSSDNAKHRFSTKASP